MEVNLAGRSLLPSIWINILEFKKTYPTENLTGLPAHVVDEEFFHIPMQLCGEFALPAILPSLSLSDFAFPCRVV